MNDFQNYPSDDDMPEEMPMEPMGMPPEAEPMAFNRLSDRKKKRKKKHMAFVLMPFNTQFDDVYKRGIKSACEEAGIKCERVDEQIFDESILDRIYNQIRKADIIIADLSIRNVNVFYETGYAHALGKRVILLTQVSENIPFDLMHYPHIVYGQNISRLKEHLVKRIKWIIKNSRKNSRRR